MGQDRKFKMGFSAELLQEYFRRERTAPIQIRCRFTKKLERPVLIKTRAIIAFKPTNKISTFLSNFLNPKKTKHYADVYFFDK